MSTHQPQDCDPPLLRLPGELRNNIYNHALVKDGNIEITPAGVPEPPLLLVCKQIRSEALKIYYGQNKFRTVESADCGPEIYAHLESRTRALEAECGLQLDCRGSTEILKERNWEKFRKWLQMVHEGVVQLGIPPPSEATDGTSIEQRVIGGMFHITALMERQEWAVVEEALNEQRSILTVLHPRWGI